MVESHVKKHENKNTPKHLTFHLSEDEWLRYHQLDRETKQMIRLVVKSIIYNPELVQEAGYIYKLLISKTISPYVCPLCLIPFSSLFALKQHIRYQEHEKECKICGKKFTSTEALLDHICKKHNICVK
ncbi:C2H2-type zinc finger protein [Acidianus manzaensis]|uniref:C2H2-type domain-containing protein n=1 Tax=Acidianus manzaensis TaxID=282676 RepID=A0A1W6K1F2_9CREN|nr:C2H2-type zinc finger protein [Acidianus manzaensis]ARM76381.1 hypothetical protein B6F84_10355 [Acidianus manzaensis]